MKKSLILGILSLTSAVATSYGQGAIALNNYTSGSHPLVTYGAGNPDGTAGTGITGSSSPGGGANNIHGDYTAGLYYVNAAGNFTANFAADASGTALPTALYSGPGTLTLSGLTGGIGSGDVFGALGEYAPSGSFNPGLGAGATVTIMIIAYNGASYATALDRAHSTAFTMVTAVGSAFPQKSGDLETDGGFSAFAVPEPSAFAMAGLGAAALMAYRRKKLA